MLYSPIEIPRFTGLNLLRDAQEVGLGAVDMLDVDLDYDGRVKQRSGWSKFNGSATMTGKQITRVFGYQAYPSTRQLMACASDGTIYALNTSGSVVTSQAAGNEVTSAVMFGGSSAAAMYLATGYAHQVYKWNGTAFSAPASLATFGTGVAVTSDFRLVTNDQDKVYFSDAGAPETFGANNWVSLMPNDGDRITGMVRWENQLFVFKNTKFFVFYGTSVDSSGNPVFNYRTVDTGIGLNAAATAGYCAAPEGVYFVSNDGIYRTTGGQPVMAFPHLRPLWRDTLGPYYQGYAVDTTAQQALEWMDGRLYLSFKEKTSGVRRMMVIDTANGNASLWSITAYGFAAFNLSSESARESLYFAPSTTAVVGVLDTSSTDNGSTITSRYRTGFFNPGVPGGESVIREWLLDGYGSVNVKVATNDGSLGSSASVTLGTAPAIAEGRDRRSVRGRNFSLELSTSSGAWSVSRVIANVASRRSSGSAA